MKAWARRLLGTGERTTGYPSSSNRASSMHLRWRFPPGAGPFVAATVTLTVEEPPSVDELYFWALQVSFSDASGRHHGAAHLGLQWHPRHPTRRAANWGGYRHDGVELRGSESVLPSTTGNPNTRDFDWRDGVPHRLHIGHDDDGWVGRVDRVPVRTLHAAGDRLTDLVMWSEVFARCDHPRTVVRWSGPEAVTASGASVSPVAVITSYQSRADGGCDNTTALPGDDGIRQITSTDRVVPTGRSLEV